MDISNPANNCDPAARVLQVVTTRTYRNIDGLCVARVGDHIVVSGRSPTFFWKQVALEAALDAARASGNVLLRFEIAVANSLSAQNRTGS